MGKTKSSFIFFKLWVPFEHIIRWNHRIVPGKLVFYPLFEFYCKRIQDAFIFLSSFCHLFVQTFRCLCLFIWQPWSWHIILTRFFLCSCLSSMPLYLLFSLILFLFFLLLLYSCFALLFNTPTQLYFNSVASLLLPYSMLPHASSFYCCISFLVFSVWRMGQLA